MRRRFALIVPVAALTLAAASGAAATKPTKHPRHHAATAAPQKSAHTRAPRQAGSDAFNTGTGLDPFAEAAYSGLIQPGARKNESDASAFTPKPHRRGRSESY